MIEVIKIIFYFILYFIVEEKITSSIITSFIISTNLIKFIARYLWLYFIISDSVYIRDFLFKSHFMPIIFRSLSHESVSTTASLIISVLWTTTVSFIEMPLRDTRYLLLRIRIACMRWVYQVVIETSRFTAIAVAGRRRVTWFPTLFGPGQKRELTSTHLRWSCARIYAF